MPAPIVSTSSPPASSSSSPTPTSPTSTTTNNRHADYAETVVAVTPSSSSSCSHQPAIRRPASHLIGLENQGATCYLNSLLQALYMTREFRRLVFEWTPPSVMLGTSGSSKDPAKDEVQQAARLQRSVPYQLQLLFARLSLCAHRRAVDTHALTHSFAWSQADSFRQHDVQELMRVLFTALERAWGVAQEDEAKQHQKKEKDEEKENTSEESTTTDAPTPITSPLATLYTGCLQDVITCNACRTTRTRSDPFQDLSLTVVGHTTLESSLMSFIKPELMDADNRLRCPSNVCNNSKQDATKYFHLSTLPHILTFQLKRFIFDFHLMQRVKVNDSFEFPERIDMRKYLTTYENEQMKPDASIDESEMMYELFAILMHSGVAQGGHYYAYLRSITDGLWYEFNDAHVYEMSGGVEAAMKAARGVSHDSESGIHKGGGSSAYMIMYRRVDSNKNSSHYLLSSTPSTTTSVSLSDLIRPEIRAIIVEEEKKYEADLAIAEKERRTLDITVHFHAYPPLKLQYDLSTPISSLTQHLLSHYQLGARRLEDMRLRKYDPSLQWASTVFECHQLDRTLEDVGFVKQNHLLLEMKQPQDEWKPHVKDSIPLRCIFITPSNVTDLVHSSLHPIVTNEVFNVELSKSLTVLDLKRAIVTAAMNAVERPIPSIPSITNQRIYIMHENQCETLRDDASLLSSYDLYPGRFLYVEHALEPELLRTTFDRLRCQIEVCYNLPQPISAIQQEGASVRYAQPDYTQRVLISRNDTLAVLKVKIASALGLELDSFRLSRTHTSSQFKDHDETLASLQLVDQSGVFVSLGRPLKKEEHMCTFYLYQMEPEETNAEKAESEASSATAVATSAAAAASPALSVTTSSAATPSRFQYLFSLPLAGTLLISDLKQSLLDFLSKKRPHATIPNGNAWNITFMRLRDKKGVNSSKAYCDASTIDECINASTTTITQQDETFEIAIQKLDQKEVWTKDMLMIQAQEWNPRTSKLSSVHDLVVRKNVSVSGMKSQLWKMMHQGQAWIPPQSTPDASSSSSTPTSVAPVTTDTSLPSSMDPLVTPALSTTPSVVQSPPILLAKGKLSGRMKRADIAKLIWLTRDNDTKLLRNALMMRSGELMIYQEEMTQAEKDAAKAAKEKKVVAAAVAASAPTISDADVSSSASTPTSASSTSSSASGKPAATTASRKPWQRSTPSGLASSSRRKPVASSLATPRKFTHEPALRIGWSEEQWLLEEADALAQIEKAEREHSERTLNQAAIEESIKMNVNSAASSHPETKENA